MADWQKWCNGLPSKREVIDMAKLLGRSRHEVASLCMDAWDWAEKNGEIEPDPTDPKEVVCVVRIVCAENPPLNEFLAVPGFAEAMSSVGWLALRTGRMTFPKFGRHNGPQARRRELQAARVRAGRAVRKVCAADAHSGESPHKDIKPPVKPFSGFQRPSLEDVKSYCAQRSNHIDPEAFIDFYESKGWMIGKNKMKDWRSAVRTWERNSDNVTGKGKRKDPRGTLSAVEEYITGGSE